MVTVFVLLANSLDGQVQWKSRVMDDLTKPDLPPANRSACRPTSTACSEVYIRYGRGRGRD